MDSFFNINGVQFRWHGPILRELVNVGLNMIAQLKRENTFKLPLLRKVKNLSNGNLIAELNHGVSRVWAQTGEEMEEKGAVEELKRQQQQTNIVPVMEIFTSKPHDSVPGWTVPDELVGYYIPLVPGGWRPALFIYASDGYLDGSGHEDIVDASDPTSISRMKLMDNADRLIEIKKLDAIGVVDRDSYSIGDYLYKNFSTSDDSGNLFEGFTLYGPGDLEIYVECNGTKYMIWSIAYESGAMDLDYFYTTDIYDYNGEPVFMYGAETYHIVYFHQGIGDVSRYDHFMFYGMIYKGRQYVYEYVERNVPQLGQNFWLHDFYNADEKYGGKACGMCRAVELKTTDEYIERIRLS